MTDSGRRGNGSAQGKGNGVVRIFDAIIVGAGFAGLYAVYRLRKLGLNVRVFEAADGVGGTWYWNRYPGARCDVESLLYSYSFSEELAREWTWTERYATQPEILRYLDHVADRFDLRRHIEFSTRVTEVHFDESTNRWRVNTEHGGAAEAQFCVMATGCLSEGVLPVIPGMANFQGSTYRTSAWPKEGVDLAGKRVGIIGTGSSAVQAIPLIADTAEHLTVFQRTPNFTVPARNTAHDPERVREFVDNFAEYRAQARRGQILGAGDLSLPPNERGPSKEPALTMTPERRREIYERRWLHGGGQFVLAFPDLMIDEAVNTTAAQFIHAKIDEIVRDPAVAQALKPRGYPLGSKRVCVDTGYYDAFNRDNVTLVNIKAAPIQRISEHGVHTANDFYPLDVLVYATGFDAITGALLKMDIRGRGGLPLRKDWEAGSHSFLGVAIAGFPNLFIVTGPGSPSVLSNMIVSIEQHVEWISDCIAYLRAHEIATIEASGDTQSTWMQNVAVVADYTLFSKGESWYKGSNIPGKPRLFLPYLGGVGTFRNICDAIAAEGYSGFTLQGARGPTAMADAKPSARQAWERVQAAGASWI
jgi:cyclohexanone monooxygenase